MGKKSRDKGRRGELEWAETNGGKRISRTGLDGPDVWTPPYQPKPASLWEVKRPGEFPVWLKKYLDQMEREGADALALREDRGTWYTIHPHHKEDDAEGGEGELQVPPV